MSQVLLWIATIATFAFIAWLATPLLDEWPKGTRLAAAAASLAGGFALAMKSGGGAHPVLHWAAFIVLVLVAIGARELAEKRRERLQAPRRGA